MSRCACSVHPAALITVISLRQFPWCIPPDGWPISLISFLPVSCNNGDFSAYEFTLLIKWHCLQGTYAPHTAVGRHVSRGVLLIPVLMSVEQSLRWTGSETKVKIEHAKTCVSLRSPCEVVGKIRQIAVLPGYGTEVKVHSRSCNEQWLTRCRLYPVRRAHPQAETLPWSGFCHVC